MRPVKYRDIVKMIETAGWVRTRTKGSHHVYRHLTRKGIVVIPGRGNKDVPPGTANSIMKQAGLK